MSFLKSFYTNSRNTSCIRQLVSQRKGLVIWNSDITPKANITKSKWNFGSSAKDNVDVSEFRGTLLV